MGGDGLHRRYCADCIADARHDVSLLYYPVFSGVEKRWYLLTFISILISVAAEAIADVYDALVSQRCYKGVLSADEAFGIMRQETGTHFDPNLVGVLLRHRKTWIDLQP